MSDTVLEVLAFLKCNDCWEYDSLYRSVLYVDSSYYIEHCARVDYTNLLFLYTFD